MMNFTVTYQQEHGDEPEPELKPRLTFFSMPAEIRQKIVDQYLTIRIERAYLGLDISDFMRNMRAALNDSEYELFMKHLRHSMQRALAAHSPFEQDLAKLVDKLFGGQKLSTKVCDMLDFLHKHRDQFATYMRPLSDWTGCKPGSIEFDLCEARGGRDDFWPPVWTSSTLPKATKWEIVSEDSSYTKYLFTDVYCDRGLAYSIYHFTKDVHFRAWYPDRQIKRDIGGFHAWSLFYKMSMGVQRICRSMHWLMKDALEGGQHRGILPSRSIATTQADFSALDTTTATTVRAVPHASTLID